MHVQPPDLPQPVMQGVGVGGFLWLSHPWVLSWQHTAGTDALSAPQELTGKWLWVREPWKMATGKKIKKVWPEKSSRGKGDITDYEYWQGPDTDGSEPLSWAVKRGAESWLRASAAIAICSISVPIPILISIHTCVSIPISIPIPIPILIPGPRLWNTQVRMLHSGIFFPFFFFLR